MPTGVRLPGFRQEHTKAMDEMFQNFPAYLILMHAVPLVEFGRLTRHHPIRRIEGSCRPGADVVGVFGRVELVREESFLELEESEGFGKGCEAAR